MSKTTTKIDSVLIIFLEPSGVFGGKSQIPELWDFVIETLKTSLPKATSGAQGLNLILLQILFTLFLGITKALLAKRVVDECQKVATASDGCKNSLDYMLGRIGSRGGAITLTKESFGFSFNTKRMPWCHVGEKNESYGINPGEHFTA